MTSPRLPSLEPSQLLDVLGALGVTVQLPRGVAEKLPSGQEEVVLGLSHGLIGAAEKQAIRAERAALSTGSADADIVDALREGFEAAGSLEVVEEIAQLSWRARRLVQAIGWVKSGSEPDELLDTTELVATALAYLLAAAHATRDPLRTGVGDQDAAGAIHAAGVALKEALITHPGLTTPNGPINTAGCELSFLWHPRTGSPFQGAFPVPPGTEWP